jgi:hypothetical protein
MTKGDSRIHSRATLSAAVAVRDCPSPALSRALDSHENYSVLFYSSSSASNISSKLCLYEDINQGPLASDCLLRARATVREDAGARVRTFVCDYPVGREFMSQIEFWNGRFQMRLRRERRFVAQSAPCSTDRR